MFELSLSKPPTKEASPATARQARTTTEKYSLLFSFCARRIFSSFNKKSIFLWASCFDKQGGGAGLYFLQGNGGIPPPKPPPSRFSHTGCGEESARASAFFFGEILAG